MRARQSLVLVLGLLLFTSLAQAQEEQTQEEMYTPPPPAEDAAMDARVGNWQGSGTMMGTPVSETSTASWALGHQFVVTQSTMTMTGPDGSEMSMEMHMVTKPNGDGTYTGMYLDSWGSMGPFTSHLDEGGNMVMEWVDPHTSQTHRVTEASTPDGGFTSTFFTQQADGSWAESGLMTYTRVTE